MDDFTVGDLWRFGVVALLLWVVFTAVEANSLLAVFAAPLLMGLWMCAVVVIDRWIQSRHPSEKRRASPDSGASGGGTGILVKEAINFRGRS
jgi:RsiW-degrading membrane proteinase PrsW (M82 family)